MKPHLSEHDLWGPGDNVVAALPLSPGDLFVIVTVDGKAALRWAIGDYEKAVNVAHAFARRLRSDRPVAIKVLPLSLAEARAMGFVPVDMFKNQTPEEEAEWKRLVHDTCIEALQNAIDPKVRAEALELLKAMGALT